MKLTSSFIENFHENGFAILDEIISPELAKSIIDSADELAKSISTDDSFDSKQSPKISKYLNLVENDRQGASKVFDALVKIPAFQRYCYSESLQIIAEQLLKTNLVLASPTQMNLRSDHPQEGRHLYPWHNDWSYNFSSANSLVFWIPLQSVDEVNGALHIIPKSHTINPKIIVHEKFIKKNQSASYFEIFEINQILESLAEVRCPLRLGQGVVFHSKLIHKSGVNLSEDTRFAVQSRWFDARAADAIKNAYIGGIDEARDPRIYLSDNLEKS
jgi:ectoine hydroxylase-related dioxygenase (phytanoyl-CoA dioxygenase family)